MKNIFQYAEDKKCKITEHDWFFEFAGCECGPFHGRDKAREMLKKFKKEYVALVRKYHGANHLNGVFSD